jgi:ABC-type transport system involved in multi-copper enzyme maturation permease subunit
MTAGMLVLVRHSLRRFRAILLAIAGLLAAFQFLLTQVATYLFRHSAFGQLSALIPDFVRNAGGSTLAFMSFAGVVAFGYFHPMVISSVIGLTIAIATEPAAEAEMRFVDLTLARPLGRADLITRTLVLMAIAIVFILGSMTAATWIGLACCTPADVPRPDGRLIASLAIGLGSVMICWAGIALAAASGARRRVSAAGLVGAAALAAYLLDYLGRAWEPAHRLSAISPFHYFEATALVAGTPLDVRDVAVLVGVGVVGAAIGFVVFSRRDI